MGEPKMNCGGEFPEWGFDVHDEEGILKVIERPMVCDQCEFATACFQNLSAHILGMEEGKMTIEDMENFVKLQRLVESEVMLTDGKTLEQLRAENEARGKTKH